MDSSTEIAEALRGALRTDRWTRAATSIEVAVQDERLILDGRVGCIAIKRRAAIMARLIRQEHEVVDRVRRSTPGTLNDANLARRAVDLISRESVFAEYRLSMRDSQGERQVLRDPGSVTYEIDVSAERGAVRVMGAVRSLGHLRLAEAIVWWIDACELVVNELQVENTAKDTDEELNDAVQMVLEKDPTIDAGQLHVTTAAGVVLLEGLLRDGANRTRIIENVWSVPGTWDIDDEIQTLN
jgi:osmotically-inducible protein OsmY